MLEIFSGRVMHILIRSEEEGEKDRPIIFFLGVSCNLHRTMISEDSLISLLIASSSKYFNEW